MMGRGAAPSGASRRAISEIRSIVVREEHLEDPAEIRRAHQHRGLSMVGYHLYLDPERTLHVGRPLEVPGAWPNEDIPADALVLAVWYRLPDAQVAAAVERLRRSYPSITTTNLS